MADLQESAHGEGHDYVAGSPHLRHPHLNARVQQVIRETIGATTRRLGRAPRVVEVGAGHGAFTDILLAAGAEVVVTEMSLPSARTLAARYHDVAEVEVVHDPDGTVAGVDELDVVLYTSVLHHIPDYLGHLDQVLARLRPGGAVMSFQDPLYYPRARRSDRIATWTAYYLWRVGRGGLARGLATTVRRVRGVYDETNVSDMSEYHVVRQGVDEVAIRDRLLREFGAVTVDSYWTTQSRLGQRLGERLGLLNTFTVVALDRSGPGRG